jgi:sec-independent protein translocase protein TatB
MLDVGWTELVVIAIVLIIVVGPKDLPPMLRTFGKMMTKMRGMANDFRHQFDEALKEADLDDVRRTLSDAQKLNPAHSLREAMNPLRQMGNEIKADLQKATTVETKLVEPAVAPAEVPAEAVTPQAQPKAEPIAATAAATATQADRVAAVAAPVVERNATTASKPKAAAVGAAVSGPEKAAAKKAKTVSEKKQPESAKAAPKKTKKKGDA